MTTRAAAAAEIAFAPIHALAQSFQTLYTWTLYPPYDFLITFIRSIKKTPYPFLTTLITLSFLIVSLSIYWVMYIWMVMFFAFKFNLKDPYWLFQSFYYTGVYFNLVPDKPLRG